MEKTTPHNSEHQSGTEQKWGQIVLGWGKGSSGHHAVPQVLLALALVLSAGFLGWFTWHGFKTYDVITTIRDMCLRSDHIRDQVIDLGHDLLITSHQGAATSSADPMPKYDRWSEELDGVLDQAAQLEREWLGEDRSAHLRDVKRLLDDQLGKVQSLVQAGDREGALGLLDAAETHTAHSAFHEAANRYVQNFRSRFQIFLEADRREHMAVVSLYSLGFLLCVAAWFFLVQWLRRSRSQLIQEVEQRRAAEAQARVLQKTEVLGEIAGGIAHDFNNVLTAIAGLAALARSDRGDPIAVVRHLDRIDEATRLAGNITGSLLRFGGHTPSEKCPLDLGEFARRILPMLRSSLPGSIDLELDVASPGEGLYTEANDLELQQVIVNLALNARDAVADQPHPRIRLIACAVQSPSKTPGIDLIVEDNGCGMSREVKERVFEPFFTTKGGGRGTGLGVPVVQRIVVEHGGSIWFDTTAGEGTRAHVWLPAATTVVELPPADTTPHPADRGDGELVLLAEDHPLVRQVLQDNLGSEGFNVIAAPDGNVFLELFSQHAPKIHALVVDYDLPGRNGIDCLQELRDAGYQTPAILITGVADREIEDRASGLALLLRKPFAIAELARLVRSQMARAGEENPKPGNGS